MRRAWIKIGSFILVLWCGIVLGGFWLGGRLQPRIETIETTVEVPITVLVPAVTRVPATVEVPVYYSVEATRLVEATRVVTATVLVTTTPLPPCELPVTGN